MSKGSKRRPCFVSEAQVARNWPKVKNLIYCPCTKSSGDRTPKGDCRFCFGVGFLEPVEMKEKKGNDTPDQ